MQLLTSLGSRKTPLNSDLVIIAPLLPGSNDRPDPWYGRQPLIQALPPQDREFNLGHIQPTVMLRGVVKLQPSRDPSGFLWLKRVIQGGWRVGIQVIQHDPDQGGVREIHIHQVLHGLRKVLLGASLGDLNVSPPDVRFQKQEKITREFAFSRIAHLK